MTHALFRGSILPLLVSTAVFAGSPNISTPSPVIYLSDNLDEADNLGWCVDTQVREFEERLHTHSSKPRGGDMQFGLENETGFIRSVAFPDYCMAYIPNDASTIALVVCNPNGEAQGFEFKVETGEIAFAKNPSLCVAVGPFMSRTLDLLSYADTPAARKQWVVRP